RRALDRVGEGQQLADGVGVAAGLGGQAAGQAGERFLGDVRVARGEPVDALVVEGEELHVRGRRLLLVPAADGLGERGGGLLQGRGQLRRVLGDALAGAGQVGFGRGRGRGAGLRGRSRGGGRGGGCALRRRGGAARRGGEQRGGRHDAEASHGRPIYRVCEGPFRW